MVAATGIWNPYPATGEALTGAQASPMDTSTSGADSTDSSATITANDFLTLLVTEMQNQDPTATTDPNEYINQLVNVNSLEQLISINQNLQTALGESTTSATPGVSSTGNGGTNASPQIASAVQQSSGSGGVAPTANLAGTAKTGARIAFGNLGVPQASAAADRVANALNGQQ